MVNSKKQEQIKKVKGINMEFYRSLIIMILERISSGEERETLLKLLKSGADLDSRERHMLRELIENSL